LNDGIVRVKDFFILGVLGISSVVLKLGVELLDGHSASSLFLRGLYSLGAASSLFLKALFDGGGDALSLVAWRALNVADRETMESSTVLPFV
jgi:hypothetical protein